MSGVSKLQTVLMLWSSADLWRPKLLRLKEEKELILVILWMTAGLLKVPCGVLDDMFQSFYKQVPVLFCSLAHACIYVSDAIHIAVRWSAGGGNQPGNEVICQQRQGTRRLLASKHEVYTVNMKFKVKCMQNSTGHFWPYLTLFWGGN